MSDVPASPLFLSQGSNNKKIDLLYITPPMKRFSDNTFLYANFYQSNDKISKVFDSGLLSIVSYLLEKGYSIKVIHILSEEDIAPMLEFASRELTPKVIAVSCRNMHTYLSAIEMNSIQLSKVFAEYTKLEKNSIKRSKNVVCFPVKLNRD